MDGFEVNPSRPVFVVAATNFDLDGTQSGKQTRLDPALIRRFDNRIYVDLPNEKERELFLTKQLEKDVKTEITQEAIHSIAQRTTGESLAILKNILELAIRNANKAGVAATDEYLLNALEEYMYGEKKEWNEEYYHAVSIHESGHAYICSLSGEKPSFVTIVSRGNFGGYMQHANEEDTPNYNKEQLLWKIRTALAGRAAEKEFFGEEKGTNTGISSDLRQATNTAMGMICRYGMDGDLLVSMSPEAVLNSPRGNQLIEQANEILKREMKVTEELVAKGRDKIQALSEFLLQKNQATEDDISRVFGLQNKEPSE
jgi:ATP-dependent Zn protease